LIAFLEKNKDYKYSFPYGHYANPQIKILTGKHKGLVFDIESSAVVTSMFENKLNVSYKILKSPEDKSVVTSSEFICHATYNFIRDFNADVAKGK
jgi:hypothetical protein